MENRSISFGEGPYLGFAAWAVVGVLAACGVASLLTIGVVLLGVASALALLLVWRGATRADSVFGLGLGAAAVIAWLGWLNRGGPGTVCQSSGTGDISCTDEWSPWPFFIVAAVLMVGTLVAAKRTRKRHAAHAE